MKCYPQVKVRYTFQCDPGYIGHPSGDCTTNGDWSYTGNCTVVTCPTPPTLSADVMSDIVTQQSYKWNDTFTYKLVLGVLVENF